MAKYRIVVDEYSGYTVERRYFFIWMSCGSTYSDIEYAEHFIKKDCGFIREKNTKGEYVGTIVKKIDTSKMSQTVWALKGGKIDDDKDLC